MELNNIERMRRLQADKDRFSDEQKRTLVAGFQSGFWKLLHEKLADTYQSLHNELETVETTHQLAKIQGEIAALKILLDWPAVLKIKE